MKKTTFARTHSDNIGFARRAWKVVTGRKNWCHDNPFEGKKTTKQKSEQFKPRFHIDRLCAPANSRISHNECIYSGQRVLVCPTADLFGDDIPSEWINLVLSMARGNPQWEYIFLTSNPRRLLEITSWPARCWVGTTVEEQSRVEEAEEVFSQLHVPYKFVACLPLLTNLTFQHLSIFDEIVIGIHPKYHFLTEDGLMDIFAQCRASETEYTLLQSARAYLRRSDDSAREDYEARMARLRWSGII